MKTNLLFKQISTFYVARSIFNDQTEEFKANSYDNLLLIIEDFYEKRYDLLQKQNLKFTPHVDHPELITITRGTSDISIDGIIWRTKLGYSKYS